jgi:F0F1-type ATP synthase assembly protein I
MKNKMPIKIQRHFNDTSLGIMFPAAIAIGFLIGYWLDHKLHTAPVLMIIFTAFGIAAGFINLFKIVKKSNAKKK